MKTIALGDTGIQVSALCLGTMYFGTKENEAVSFRLLDQYLDAGGTFLDTANSYACWVNGFRGGESETLLGRWMHLRKNRDRVFLATKMGFAYPGSEAGASAKQIIMECEKSLQRMGVETIDLYYIHLDDRATPLEETLGALDRLIREGKIRQIGASHFLAWRLEEAYGLSQHHGWAKFCCVQQCHTYLRPRPGTANLSDPYINDDLLDYARSRPISLLAYNALLSGAYTRPERAIPGQYLGPDSDERLFRLRRVAAEKNVTPNQIVLSWMLHQNPKIIPLIGASTGEQLAENLQAVEVSLNQEEMDRLEWA